MESRTPSPLRQLQIVALGLILGPIVFLGIALLLRATGTPLGNVEVLSYVAIAYAIASPLIAGSVRASMTASNTPGPPPSPDKARTALIVPLAILEAAAFLCGIALLLTPTYWPLIAAAIPLGTMLLWFPRAG